MTTSYLQLSLLVWGFLLATAVGVALHTTTTRRRDRAFTRHATSALALLTCWPAREADDDCVRCGECDALWTRERNCPQARP